MAGDFKDTILTDLRIFWRILQETGGGIQRTNWMNVVIVVTMASILSIFGTLFAFMMDTQLFVENIGSGLKLSVYAKDGANVTQLQQAIQGLPEVVGITVVTKDKAWQDMKQTYDVPDIQNPLPDTLHVQVKDKRYLEPAASKVEAMPGVEKVQFAKSILLKLQRISRVTSAVGFAVNLFFGILTLLIISNTIHLLIQARYQEIEILRMMGVSNWYIQLPFLFQGAFYGLSGALIAYLPLTISQHYINELFAYFQFTGGAHSPHFVFGVLVLMGLVVGAGGAMLSVHRYLKV